MECPGDLCFGVVRRSRVRRVDGFSVEPLRHVNSATALGSEARTGDLSDFKNPVRIQLIRRLDVGWV